MGKIYVGDANNIARQVKGIYVGDSNGIARKVLKGYVGDANGIAREFYSAGFTPIIGTFSGPLTSNNDWVSFGNVLTAQQVADLIAAGATQLHVTCNCDYTSTTRYPFNRGLDVHARQTSRPNAGAEEPYLVAYTYGFYYEYLDANVPKRVTVSGSRALANTPNGLYIYAIVLNSSSSEYPTYNIRVSGNYEITFE